MEIISYHKKYKDAVYELHKTALQKEKAYIGKGVWDEDLRDIEKSYLKDGAFLLGVIDEELVAMGAFRMVSDDKAEVKRMRVQPKHQHQGLGQKIYDELEKLAKEKGIKILACDTSSLQENARAFYKKNGFKEVKRERLESLDCDLIYFEKAL